MECKYLFNRFYITVLLACSIILTGCAEEERFKQTTTIKTIPGSAIGENEQETESKNVYPDANNSRNWG